MPDHRRMRHSLRHSSFQPVAHAVAPGQPQVPFLRAGMAIKHVETSKKRGSGEFEAVISTFNNRVSYGFPGIPDDRILPGAVAESIERGFPAIAFSHMFEENPPIGVTQAIEERGDDLYAKGRLFVGQNRLADEVFVAMSETGGDGRPPLREFSISGPIISARMVVEDEEEIRDIVELDLWEWGPCLRGANQTQLLSVGGDAVQQARESQGNVAHHDELDTDAKKATPPEAQPAEAVPASKPNPEPDEDASARSLQNTQTVLPVWALLPTPRHL